MHLVEPLGRDGAGQDRYRLHDLVADFAREEVRAVESARERTAALPRLLDGLARARGVGGRAGAARRDVPAAGRGRAAARAR